MNPIERVINALGQSLTKLDEDVVALRLDREAMRIRIDTLENRRPSVENVARAHELMWEVFKAMTPAQKKKLLEVAAGLNKIQVQTIFGKMTKTESEVAAKLYRSLRDAQPESL